MVGMRQQGAWTRWEQAVDQNISWPDLWKAEPQQIKFLIQSVYDVLPCPTNLVSWGLTESPACPLCLKRGSLEHREGKLLPESPGERRHDQVLRVIAEAISTGISSSRQQQPVRHTITFARAGEKPHYYPSSSGGLVATAQDWQLKVDLGRQLKFSDTIAATTLRPDIVLVSELSRQAVLLEYAGLSSC